MFGLPTLYVSAMKYIAILLAVVGVLFGTYEFGNRRGYESGYTVGAASKQPTIDSLTATINEQRTAEANKAQAVASTAANEVIADTAKNNASQQVRTQILDHYHTVVQTVPGNCGVSEPTVTAIDAMLDTQAVYDTPISTLQLPTAAPTTTGASDAKTN